VARFFSFLLAFVGFGCFRSAFRLHFREIAGQRGVSCVDAGRKSGCISPCADR
jgi:hypothetical protein